MLFSSYFRVASASIASLPLMMAMSMGLPAQAQPTTPRSTPANTNDLRPLVQDTSLLSMQGGRRLINESLASVQSQDYATAIVKLQQARQVFNQLSNFYQQLSSSFSGIDNRVADIHRQSAVEAAEMRDQSTYQLALVHRAQNQPELAVPLLIQIIRSQNPTTDLGKKAYEQLVQLGFVNNTATNGVPTSSTP
jgi:hypothetical protein